MTTNKLSNDQIKNEGQSTRLFYDPNSLSSFNGYRIVHTHFDLNVDFDSNILYGYVQLDVKPLSNELCDCSSTIKTENKEIPNNYGNQVVLDSRHLNIKKVLLKSNDIEKSLSFQVDIERESLTIEMNDESKDSTISIIIHYSTSNTKCSALQWLTKEQTADRQYPYMFSQCQAIHARSLYPCQDTPGVKSTFTAKVKCPKPLTVLMSGLQTNYDENTNTFYFEQQQAIPSYLIAIAVGKLASYDLSPRIRVWTESSMIRQCQYEFEHAEQFLTAAEQLLGEYQWKRYDFLVLPPSFPYGGMENPCMNFLTPTLLAGDRSLISTIVHEMTHSWTGNLVTNENWEHFWLNEGFTSFIEAKILGNLDKANGKEVRRFHAAQQWQDLQTAVATWGAAHPYTCLVYRLNNTDPDDAYSSVQYYKGAAFLWYLEQDVIGSESDFDEFLRSYIIKFGRKILNTDDFIQYFQSYFPQAPSVDWQSWLYTPGMPPITHDFSTKLEEQCNQLATQLSPITKEQMNMLNAKQVAYLLNVLLNHKSTINRDYIEQLDTNCDMSKYSNCEICFRWYQLCIRVKFEKYLDNIFEFLKVIGRMKFVKPLYAEFKSSWPELIPRVQTFFDEHKKYMNPITVKQIEIRLNSQN
ncbi:unnamed protein product [Rotaria magnacalcarata]|uniref:Peptidase M1 leukotriene A4 hydrolase/aminopeptidase C-terminal domain-containing protein n=1 Tax=Rotaria magnacalcarata TaxID=392030 RepID=A0A816WQ28_9BILA|nr:unnamed protein product [Rotaria magnacalcarata]CAF2151123.1 unnamed protein product [Rotaria magnacalcarata]CAF3938076.1 unnamed protein product [Rotaria magnacalcarata]CAF4048654.1 unnamed protein product [Rotaria magnacalcarata]